jgi:metalloendopeptidase OMA1, mitochondrial
MAAAGYDPREAVKFWQRMDESTNAGRPPEFTSTHPSHQHRVRDLESWLGEAAPIYEKSEQQKIHRFVQKPAG